MALCTQDVDFLCEIIAENSGNVVTARQEYLLDQQLKPVAISEGLPDVESLVTRLKSRQDRNLFCKIAEAITVNETSFFRDIHPFETLRTHVIPDLIKRNAASKQIRIWCGASSSGQEPYSLAIVAREALMDHPDFNVQIVASDLSTEMLTRTREGKYTQLEVNRGLPMKRLIQCFDKCGTGWQAKPELRDMIECRRLNLVEPWPYMGQFDIIFVRNVLIYFDQENKVDILKRASQLLRPEGYLFIGSSEVIIGLSLPLKREEINDTVCYRPL